LRLLDLRPPLDFRALDLRPLLDLRELDLRPLLDLRELDLRALDLRPVLLRPLDDLRLADLRPELFLPLDDLRPEEDLVVRLRLAPPFRPPLRAGALFVLRPRPEPLFLPPPDDLFTVAQARRSASSFDTPRFS